MSDAPRAALAAAPAPGGVCRLVVADAPPADPALDGLDLFNTPAFFALHAPAFPGARYCVARHPATDAPLAVAHFAEVEPGHLRSPARGSFGGIEFVAPEPDVGLVEQVVAAVDAAAEEAGARSLTLVLPPGDYHPAATALVLHVLLRAGFRVVGHELNYAIPVVAGSLVPQLDHGNRKRVNAAQRLGLRFSHLSPEALPDAYAVVAENRAKRGYPMTMTLDALRAMDRAISGRVRCFGVLHEGALIAASVCVRVRPEILYVFYWGEVAGAERLSPVSFLATEIYVTCVRDGVRLLDVGTSTVGGVPNYGLIRFKKNLGCRESLKFTLRKDYAWRA